MSSPLKFICSILAIAAIGLFLVSAKPKSRSKPPRLGVRSVKLVRQQGLPFKDLNKNGRVDVYEDWRKPPPQRVADLLAQMTLEEKAGVMMHGTAPAEGPAGMGAHYNLTQADALINGAKVNTFITRLSGNANDLAAENNKLQELAESARLGIPATVSTDPRNQFQYTVGAGNAAGGFSKWPGPLGLAATQDPVLVRRFGDVARREYLAVGIREALSPQADLATEPRWSRIDGTFGEDPDLAKKLVAAYVEGFQNGSAGITAQSVITVVKHWVGYGAQKNGFDSHNAYARFALFPKHSLDYHTIPFTGAFSANVGGVMPTYSILEGAMLDGKPLEQVGGGFNAQLLGMLRHKFNFQGVILSDWAITNDCGPICTGGFPPGQKPDFSAVAMPWGVEKLSKADRFAKTINAGVDQIGGTEDAKYVIAAVQSGKISQARVDEAVTRVLLQKFQQGLFEDPYVDSSNAADVVANAQFLREALDAQRRSIVVLENKDRFLPIKGPSKRVFLYDVDPKAVVRYGFSIADSPETADLAIVRAAAPYQTLHPQYLFGSMQHEGSLAFDENNPAYQMIQRCLAKTPTVVSVYLDRPAILTNFSSRVSAVLVNFGVSDRALLDVVTGRAKPTGKLPFDLPSSMEEVEKQSSDTAHDLAHPLYKFGYGLTF